MVTILSKPLSLPYVQGVPAGIDTFEPVIVSYNERPNVAAYSRSSEECVFRLDRSLDTFFERGSLNPFNPDGRDESLRVADAFALAGSATRRRKDDLFLKIGDYRHSAIDIYSVLRHPTALRGLAETGSVDVLRLLGDYGSLDKIFTSSSSRMKLEALDARSGQLELFNAICDKYFQKKGFEPTSQSYGALLTAANLLALKDKYDVFIPIATKGLYSGAMAELLGLKTIAVEIHANKRKKPEIRWLDTFAPEDLKGKRILVLENDIISGATVRAAQTLLASFRPAQVDVLLNLCPGELQHEPTHTEIKEKVVPGIERTGTRVLHPGNAPRFGVQAAFDILDYALKTPRGRLMRIKEKFYREYLPFAEYIDAELAHKLWTHFNARLEFLSALNPMTDGYEEILANNANELEIILQSAHEAMIFFAQGFTDRGRVVGQLEAMCLSERFLVRTAEDLIKARYFGWGRNVAAHFEIENEHIPHDYLASFETAVSAAKEGYDYALIVGPEGLAYAPMFLDLGIPIKVVNIPESTGSKRSFKAFFKMRELKNKRVLVVEDDIHTGLTLKKLLEKFGKNTPAKLGLFLGSNPYHQWEYNIPPEFQHIHMTSRHDRRSPEEGARIFLTHLQEREFLFQSTPLGLHSILK